MLRMLLLSLFCDEYNVPDFCVTRYVPVRYDAYDDPPFSVKHTTSPGAMQHTLYPALELNMTSVAEPGSVAFLTPGSGIRDG